MSRKGWELVLQMLRDQGGYGELTTKIIMGLTRASAGQDTIAIDVGSEPILLTVEQLTEVIYAHYPQRELCKVSWCNNYRHSDGLCRVHWKAKRRGEDPEQHILQPRIKWAGKLCQKAECNDPAKVRGYCSKHYNQARYRGEIQPLMHRNRQSMKGITCHHPGCKLPAFARYYCNHHYNIRYHRGEFTEEILRAKEEATQARSARAAR